MLLPYLIPGISEAGCDEAGRGCLAGPVVAAAVILPDNFSNNLIDDSKKLTPSRREQLRHIIEDESVTWAVAFIDSETIDRINILNASILAMHHALGQLHKIPQHIIVDGNRFKPYNKIPHTTVVKGDGKYLSVAAASILAKTHRDEYMQSMALKYPGYGWEHNMGYPTRDHRKAILDKGLTPLHRITFGPCAHPSLFD